jgi:hypothetical protein
VQATQLLSTEYAEKMKILAHEIEIKRNESLTKDKALQAEITHYQMVCADRDSSRGEINKASYTCQLKEG